jgi:hypothetical protein
MRTLPQCVVGRRPSHPNYAVDGGKARLSVGVLVTPAEVQDNQAFPDLLDRARFRFHLHVRRAVADSKYATMENLRGLEQRGIRAYMPLVAYRKRGPFFRQQDFVYDPDTDSYRCPQGETLPYRARHADKEVTIYQAPDATCAPCPRRARCTDGASGRRVTRPFDEDLRERLRERQTTEAYQKALRKRQVWVEPRFGEAKQWHQLRQFRLRGLDNVNIQALLVATGQNLKRYVAATTRGQRPALGQRAAVRFRARWHPGRRSRCRLPRHFQRAATIVAHRKPGIAWLRLVMDGVNDRNHVEGRVAGQLRYIPALKAHIAHAELRRFRLPERERVRRDVKAGELRCRVRLSHLEDRIARAAAHIRHPHPRLQALSEVPDRMVHTIPMRVTNGNARRGNTVAVETLTGDRHRPRIGGGSQRGR